MIYKGRQLGACLVILFIIYVIERYILAWTANIDEHWEEWNNIPLNEAAIKEEKRREKEKKKEKKVPKKRNSLPKKKQNNKEWTRKKKKCGRNDS